jgi:hypothetical protein
MIFLAVDTIITPLSFLDQIIRSCGVPPARDGEALQLVGDLAAAHGILLEDPLGLVLQHVLASPLKGVLPLLGVLHAAKTDGQRLLFGLLVRKIRLERGKLMFEFSYITYAKVLINCLQYQINKIKA